MAVAQEQPADAVVVAEHVPAHHPPIRRNRLMEASRMRRTQRRMFVAIALGFMILSTNGGIAEPATKTCSVEYPYMCSGALRDAELSDLPDGVIAQCDGITVSQKDLDAQIRKLTGSTRDQARSA